MNAKALLRYHGRRECRRASPGGTHILTSFQAVALLISATLLAPAVAPAQTAPDPTNALQSVRAAALAWSGKLPDFICTQTTRRDVWNMNSPTILGTGMSGVGPAGSAPNPVARSGREIVEQVTYIGQKENYQVLAVDGRKVSGVSHLQLQGAITAGEFGSALHDIFDPASHTTFTPGRRVNVHGRRAWVFGFRVPEERGNIVILHEPTRAIVVPYSGQIFVDPGALDVLRIHSVLELPPGLPLQHAETTVDYRLVTIAGRKYNLPWHSEVRLQDLTSTYDNTIDFRHYHEFVAQAKILGESGTH
ncbi:MAG TPA: hypothetical protein VJS11_12190 [Acidobacteriaceae bacterium]|nr:hypothetical protein [Acidobacteriaceae bacterium]